MPSVEVQLPGSGAKNNNYSVTVSSNANESSVKLIVDGLFKIDISANGSSLDGTIDGRQDRLALDLPQHTTTPPSLVSPPITPPQISHSPYRRVSVSLSNIPETSRLADRPPSPPQTPTPARSTRHPHPNGFLTPQSSPVSEGTINRRSAPKGRAISEPPTSTTPDTRCVGYTREGERCRKKVKKVAALSCLMPDASPGRLCHWHIKSDKTGFFAHDKPVDTWVEYSEWIPNYLSPETQAALREEMIKPISPSDKAGYIYAFEIRKPGSDLFCVKVGRSTQVARRLSEWEKQCPSEEAVLRGWWPGNIQNSDNGHRRRSIGSSKGTTEQGPKGKYSHRLERLIHLELADIAVNSLHLMQEYAQEPSAKKDQDFKTSRPNKRPSVPKLAREPCPDCNQNHREIFPLARIPAGEMSGREWEQVVKPIIEKWGRFVTEYA